MENSIVQISNTLNLTKQEFNVLEKQFLFAVLSSVKEQQGFQLGLFDDETTPVVVKFDSTYIKETNIDRIKEAIKSITRKQIHFDLSNSDNITFGSATPFTYAKYESKRGSGHKGNFTIHINGVCKSVFLELANGYTKADLNRVLSLKSNHAIRLYELIQMHCTIGSWAVSIDELKFLLNIDKDKYKSFTLFELKVLKYCQLELWDNCNLHFEWEIDTKIGKKIHSLIFYIKSREKKITEIENQQQKEDIDYINSLPSDKKAYYAQIAFSKYSLSKEQSEYIINNSKIFKEFIRIDTIIDKKIEKGTPPKDRTAYLAKSLKFDTLGLKNSSIKIKKKSY